jgi:beta-lactamase regulating signal transducer with metallopeptidase domain
MRTSSQLLLTFILNACWQIALIAALAAIGSWLLRNSVARYRHWLWVSALCLAFLVPATTSLRALLDTVSPSTSPTEASLASEAIRPLLNETAQDSPGTATLPASAWTFQLSQGLGFALLILYCGFLLYRSFKLIQAWQTTRTIRRLAVELEPNDQVAEIISTCEREIDSSREVKVFRSETLPVPVTIGLLHPIIILPESLLREDNVDLLTSAIGHEFIHVARRDYLLNLIYELLFVPISFHPAAALLRRRVKETRELCCDELVAERIVNAEVYARSLVRLASSAPPLRRLSVTTTVGIADADILEARIMSLLRKPELNTRWKKPLLIVVSLLLLLPCVAAAGFAMRFEVVTNAQEPVVQDQQRKEKVNVDMLHPETRIREQMMKERMATDPAFREEVMRKHETEVQIREVMHTALVRLAKVNMDQAIQVATSQTPGKVLMCSLDAKGWEEPGKLGKDGVVFYHVIIADEVTAGTTHVWVNAVDGTIMRTDKDLPKRVRVVVEPQ